MISHRRKASWRFRTAYTGLALISLASLSGCDGFEFPPVDVAIPLAQGVELSALSGASGSADVILGAFCGLFDEEELDARVRAAAGDLIADHVTITRIELDATDISATSGDFAPYTSATLRLTVLEPGSEPLLLGFAADTSGLGGEFALTQSARIDLLRELGDDECGVPTLHLEGADPLEPDDATFNVTVRLLVYTQLTLK